MKGAEAVRISLFQLEDWQGPNYPEVQARLSEVVQRGRFILGPEVKAVEREFASYLGVSHGT